MLYFYFPIDLTESLLHGAAHWLEIKILLQGLVSYLKNQVQIWRSKLCSWGTVIFSLRKNPTSFNRYKYLANVKSTPSSPLEKERNLMTHFFTTPLKSFSGVTCSLKTIPAWLLSILIRFYFINSLKYHFVSKIIALWGYCLQWL